MTDGHFGMRSGARAMLAFMLAAAPVAPATAQQAETPAPAPSTGRDIDFRLPPPTDDGRAPGVQGPADNGLPPVGPGERGGPTPTPAPTPAPPRVIPTQPATAPGAAPSARGASAGPAAPRSAAPSSSATDVAATPSPPLSTDGPAATAAPLATDTAPPSVDDDATPGTAPTGDEDTPLWAWLLAALAAAAAGFWYWRRRPALVGDAPAERSALPPEAACPVPSPAPPPAARATVPPPRPSLPLVTRPVAERRAQVTMALEVHAIRMTHEHVAVAFTLTVANQGAVDATGLMVRVAIGQGSAMTEPVLARFFDGAGGSVLRDDMTLGVGGREALSTEALLPRAIVEPLTIAGKPMLVPVIAFDVTYHWDGDADAFGQVAGSFVLGREPTPGGSDKLAPLPLDRASYQAERPGARATAVRRTQ